jgi:hypothetical protein
MNMVEFGAGGTIVQPEAEVPAAASDGAAGTAGDADGANAEAGASTGVTLPTAANTGLNSRRKRKAKGWFCPVCRQRTYHFLS